MIAFMSALRVTFNSFTELPHRPWPLSGTLTNPKREKLGTVGIDSACRRFVGRIDQRQSELIAEDLKRGELADKIGIDAGASKQLQDVTDIPQLGETVPRAAYVFKLMP